MTSFESFFRSAPQNPYLFAILFVLAVFSGWSPTKKAIRLVSSFIFITVQSGIASAWSKVSERLEKKANDIVKNPAKGSIIILMDFGSIGVSIINFVSLLLLGIMAVGLAGLDAKHPEVGLIIALVVVVAAGISFLILAFEMLFEALLFRRVRRMMISNEG